MSQDTPTPDPTRELCTCCEPPNFKAVHMRLPARPSAPVASAPKEAESRRDFNEAHAVCLDCGLDYSAFGMDVLLPRWQWLLIHPDEGGLLCARCIVLRASRLPGAVGLEAVIGIAPSKDAAEYPNKAGARPTEAAVFNIPSTETTILGAQPVAVSAAILSSERSTYDRPRDSVRSSSSSVPSARTVTRKWMIESVRVIALAELLLSKGGIDIDAHNDFKGLIGNYGERAVHVSEVDRLLSALADKETENERLRTLLRAEADRADQ